MVSRFGPLNRKNEKKVGAVEKKILTFLSMIFLTCIAAVSAMSAISATPQGIAGATVEKAFDISATQTAAYHN